MANTRYKGANSSERLTLSTLSDSDMFQTRHLPGTVNDADKGVSKALLQALPIAVCATAATTAAKVAALAPESCPDFSLVNGRTVHIYFSAANTASVPTLNLAGTGALPITYPDGSYVGEWPAGCCLDLMYISIADGNTAIERWVLVSSLPVDEVTLNNMQSVTSNAVAEKLSDIQIGQFTDISNYFANGANLSFIQKNNSLVILKFNGSSGDTKVPSAGWTTIAKVPYKPISDVANVIVTDVHNVFAIRITINGELQVYNYQNTPILIDASEMICYFTND